VQEVEKKCQCAGNCGCGTKPVKSFSDLVSSSSTCCGFGSSLEGKDESNSAIGSRGVASGDNFAFAQSSASVITLVHPSTNESAGCCGSPRSEVTFVGLNSEAVLGFELDGSQPTNGEGLERVVEGNALIGVDNLWLDNKDPEQKIESNSVFAEPESVTVVAGGNKTQDNSNFCCKNQTKVDPAADGSVDVFSGHVSQTTPSTAEELVGLVSQEGN